MALGLALSHYPLVCRSAAKLDEVRRVLGAPQAQHAGTSLDELVAELQHHTELLARIKADLDAIYRKIRRASPVLGVSRHPTVPWLNCVS
jgi:hypothetical protein